MVALLLLCTTLALAAPARAEHSFKFASVSEGRQLLAARDSFVEAMSQFDRAFRLRADREISESEYLAFVEQSVLEWESKERSIIECTLQQIGPALSRLFTPSREPIYLIKTTGKAELGSAYTRGNAIVLQRWVFALDQRNLRRILAHEFFHIFSRNNPKLRQALYEAIGFQHCGKVEFPVALHSRMLANPDAPRNEHCIRVSISGKQVWAVPVFYSPRLFYSPKQDNPGVEHFTFALMLVEKDSLPGVARPIRPADGPLLARAEQVSGFFEQVGRNTSYIIHPEEILAENAALLAMGETSVPSPEILSRMQRLLEAARVGNPAPGKSAREDSRTPTSDCAKSR